MITLLGATGNVGSKIAGILLRENQRVRVISRSFDKAKSFRRLGAEVYVGDAADSSFLTNAFTGSDGVFTLLPPDFKSTDYLSLQDRVGESIAGALRASGVKFVVNLSSTGADLADGNGPIKGLHKQEERLNALDLNVLHLRPVYFMENLLMNIDLIRTMGIMGSALKGDLRMPMIATRDIAAAAADALIKRNFPGKRVRDLLGQRDLTMDETAKIIGKKIGKSDLKYVAFSYDDALKGMVGAGLSENVSRLYLEMSKGMNDGLFGGTKIRRTPDNTTATPVEEFADVFAEAYRSKMTKAA